MNYNELLDLVNSLEIGERKKIYEVNNNQIIIFRPEKLGASLKSKDYDIKKNFQIILKKSNEKEFLPNHLRVMIDLNHIVKNQNSDKFFKMVENVYSGRDPLDFMEEIEKLNLIGELDEPIVTLCLIQLFMSEQDTNYTHGKVRPPRAYLMGYLRFIKSREENIDKVLWSSTRHPPRQEFWKEDKLREEFKNI